MKKLFFTMLAAIALQANGYSQTVTWHTIDSVDYYEVAGCRSGAKSFASFYSSIGGGHFVKSVAVDSNGNAVFIDSNRLRPAMVLNSGDSGTKNVCYVGPREFMISSAQISDNRSSAVTSWQGAGNSTEIVKFQVLKSSDGIDYETVGTESSATADSRQFKYDENWVGEAVFYKIAVVTEKGIRHTTQPMRLIKNVAISIYPTQVNQSINITCQAIAENAGYRIIDNTGKLVIAGKLESTNTAVSVPGLTPGIYNVLVQNGKEKQSAKIVKL